jgi:HAD superfamily hydrolase (TIGR01549 family)
LDPQNAFIKLLEEIRGSITTLFFDLDGTLRLNEPDATGYFYDQAEKFGVHSTPERRREAERWTHVYWASSSELLQDLETFGDWNNNGAFWQNHARRHLKVLGASDADAARLALVITETMLEEYNPVDHVRDDVRATLQALRTSGRSLAVVSNRSDALGPMLDDLGLSEYFEFSLAAGEVDYWKPDPRLLLHAASIAAARPEEIVYVGDNYYADVVCARQAGMMPILYDPKGIFPDADCVIITQMRELLNLLDDRR